MATSSYPVFARQSPRTQVIAHVTLKAAQSASILTPAFFLFGVLVQKRPATVSRYLRVTMRNVVAGALVGTAMGYGRLYNQSEEAIMDRAERLRYNVSQVRSDDYSFIGASLAAVVTPALLLRRAPLPVLVLGGASFGLGAGVLAHVAMAASEGQDMRPEGMVGEIPIIGGNDKK